MRIAYCKLTCRSDAPGTIKVDFLLNEKHQNQKNWLKLSLNGVYCFFNARTNKRKILRVGLSKNVDFGGAKSRLLSRILRPKSRLKS